MPAALAVFLVVVPLPAWPVGALRSLVASRVRPGALDAERLFACRPDLPLPMRRL
jgi:hypothetical protein